MAVSTFALPAPTVQDSARPATLVVQTAPKQSGAPTPSSNAAPAGKSAEKPCKCSGKA